MQNRSHHRLEGPKSCGLSVTGRAEFGSNLKEQWHQISNSSGGIHFIAWYARVCLAKCEWDPLHRHYSISSVRSIQRLNRKFTAMRHRQHLDVFSKLLGHASGAEWQWASSDVVEPRNGSSSFAFLGSCSAFRVNRGFSLCCFRWLVVK